MTHQRVCHGVTKLSVLEVIIPATPFAGTERVRNLIRPYNADLSGRPKAKFLDNKTRSPNSPQDQHIDIAADLKETLSLTTSPVTISLGIEDHNVIPIKKNLLTLFDLRKLWHPFLLLRKGNELLVIIRKRTVATLHYLTKLILGKVRNCRDIWLLLASLINPQRLPRYFK